jgi:murein L,D-transpeptidase YcbB/YkuD
MQSRIGVSVDGIYGPNTRTAMKFRPTEGNCGKLKAPLTKG